MTPAHTDVERVAMLPCFSCRCDHGEIHEVVDPHLPHLLYQVECGVCAARGGTATDEADAAKTWNLVLRAAMQPSVADAAKVLDAKLFAGSYRNEQLDREYEKWWKRGYSHSELVRRCLNAISKGADNDR